MILHICSRAAWEEAIRKGEYQGDTLATQGFIHCSTPEQVIEVANYMFKGRTDLILILINEKKIPVEIKYEDAGNGKLYPHIYGPLNLEAVVETIDFPSKDDGSFDLPAGAKEQRYRP